ncbi:uncharacterized protein PGTG_07663 [Puccinia graminis f. sp. tritici CRL 75-36-700-3]|uniref:Uncharacterized protein n=1 Tax=Puccinia graminis f. sp. tritici (strain CRL 75-36-700-3 / race SCCL) TaxID=418459 RepID=E3KCY8_PUCGT|nr:uncharacterized protein PGTG_07663 [Puccinia graminis f. sp. tritici CRL 75-36-700-3]EFP82266.1 hypothetical protein PGTG_07663 [Puccinia graminis f. sp. tritici CRL 75-36-700-3]
MADAWPGLVESKKGSDLHQITLTPLGREETKGKEEKTRGTDLTVFSVCNDIQSLLSVWGMLYRRRLQCLDEASIGRSPSNRMTEWIMLCCSAIEKPWAGRLWGVLSDCKKKNRDSSKK